MEWQHTRLQANSRFSSGKMTRRTNCDELACFARQTEVDSMSIGTQGRCTEYSVAGPTRRSAHSQGCTGYFYKRQPVARLLNKNSHSASEIVHISPAKKYQFHTTFYQISQRNLKGYAFTARSIPSHSHDILLYRFNGCRH